MTLERLAEKRVEYQGVLNTRECELSKLLEQQTELEQQLQGLQASISRTRRLVQQHQGAVAAVDEETKWLAEQTADKKGKPDATDA